MYHSYCHRQNGRWRLNDADGPFQSTSQRHHLRLFRHHGQHRRYTHSLFILLFIILAATVPSVAAESVDQTRTVRVGVYENQPKVFTDEDGQATGLFIDLFDEIAEKERWKPIYVPCQWAECLRALEEGRLDLMPDVAYSRERDERFDFHRLPVSESWSRLYAGPGKPIEAMSELAGKRVALLQGSIQQKEFVLMMSGFGYDVTMVPTESYEESFRLVQDGSVDVAIANHFFGDYFYRKYGLIKTPIVFQMSELYFATAEGRNSDLLKAINRHLKSWRRAPNSAYYLALARWMERPPRSFVPRYIAWTIGIAVGLLVLAGGLIFVLRQQVRKRTKHLDERTVELNEALLGTITAMSVAVEKRDPYTAGHQIRVAKLAKAMAKRLDLAEKKVEGVFLAGLIHDIGKISIPAIILTKRSELSAEDLSLIRRHPQTGFEILNPIKFPWPIAQIVYQHHERMDGSGYPQGLNGDAIIMEARILAVADVVETMTLHRPYREALGLEAALDEIDKNKGILYDPSVVDACKYLFRNGINELFKQ